jgi:hypothetical protein
MRKIANKDARQYVKARKVFHGSNIFAEIRSNGIYVVWSYGYHWPLFVHTQGMWFENSEKYSQTTSVHRSKCHPHCDTVGLSKANMQKLIDSGYVTLVADRVIKGEINV